MEDNKTGQTNETEPLFEESDSDARTWFQDNLRIIVSVFIVGAIALGIYSYSQRSTDTSEELGEEELTMLESPESVGDVPASVSAPATESRRPEMTAPKELSRETEGAFMETAERGDGTTHLARRALWHHLEKSPDSTLTSEHMVYVEDYLRKNIAKKGGLRPGESVEFSKSLIDQAIERSKTLTPRQLSNLKKYSARVAAYR
jgi:hypothetical protein